MFLALYDYFERHRRLLWTMLAVIVCLLAGIASRLEFKEDIADFLPVDEQYRKAMQVYQDVAVGNRIVLLFSQTDTLAVTDADHITDGVEAFGTSLARLDTAGWLATGWQPQVDVTQVLDVISFIYEHLPIYLTPADYAAFDSLWQSDPDLLRHRLEHDIDLLGSSAGTFVQPVLQHDPLGVGQHVSQLMRQYQPALRMQQVDGYTFTPDGRRCMVTLTTPFGSSESAGNARLLDLLDEARAAMQSDTAYADIDVCCIGSPVIAVANAGQIRHDTTWAILISAILILALLYYAFRSWGAMLQIVISTAFGFLVALGSVALVRDSVSVIVLGIASIIIGIAVNYPLHYLCHLQHEPSPRQTLRELVKPLFIGNVTTVGAFLTLVPLDATAICDLGLFSAMMLVGTIIFVLVFQPHIRILQPRSLGDAAEGLTAEVHAFDRLGQHITSSRLTWPILIVVTAVFGWFSLDTSFDTDLNHINYMTDRQRADLAYLSSLQGNAQGSTVYVAVASDDAQQAAAMLQTVTGRADSLGLHDVALSHRNPVELLPSPDVQRQRIGLWHAFWRRHGFGHGLSDAFVSTAQQVGFTAEAFEPFAALLADSVPIVPWDDFEPLTSTILTGLVRDGQLVAQYVVPEAQVADVEQRLQDIVAMSGTTTAGAARTADAQPEVHVFDLASLNSRVADTLSDNFNYIGFACSCIVFLFLWCSFRRLKLAIIAFLPMVIGWIWILGMMQIFGMQFNIVNIILATFIFGQGDDYTIFVTEGLVREYQEGRRVLVSYQRSILLSALIMLIGIGSLIIARHPAMHSLASVTIVGMAVVVIMAWFIPPLVFKLFNNEK